MSDAAPPPPPQAPADRAAPAPWAWPDLLALGLVAVVHLLALQLYSGTAAARHPMVDAFVYWDQAQALLRGDDPFAEGYYQPPAYPYLLSALGGLTGGLSLTLTRAAQVGLSLLSTLGVLALGRRIGADLGLRWVGPVAALLFGLYPTLVLFALDILTPAWTGAAVVGALCALLLPAGRPGLLRLLVAGLALGLAAALHPTHLLLGLGCALLVGLGWIPSAVAAGAGLGLQRGLAVGALALGLAAPLAPTALHNYRQFGVFELVSHNAGLNLYLGNSPRMEEVAFLRAGLPFRKLVLDAEPDDRDLPARNAYWRGRLASEVGADPGGALRVQLTKLRWGLHDTEIPRNEDLRCRTRSGQALAWLRWAPVRYGMVLSAAWMGWLALRRRQATAAVAAGLPRWPWVLGIAWLALHLPLQLFLVSDRYRVATWPVLALLAGVGVATMIERWPWRAASGQAPTPPLEAARALFGPGALGLASLLLVPAIQLVPIEPPSAKSETWCTYTDANLAFEEGRLDEAQALYLAVLADWPDDMGAHSWLAYIAARREDWPTAIRHMREVTRQFPLHFPSWRDLADWQLKVDDRPGAVNALMAAYTVPGDRTATGVKLVKLLRSMGRDAEAEALLNDDPKLRAHPKLQGG